MNQLSVPNGQPSDSPSTPPPLEAEPKPPDPQSEREADGSSNSGSGWPTHFQAAIHGQMSLRELLPGPARARGAPLSCRPVSTLSRSSAAKSLNAAGASASVSSPGTILLQAELHGADATALWDTGAEANFLSWLHVQRLGLQSSLQPSERTVKYADGSVRNARGEITLPLRLLTPGSAFTCSVRFVVADLQPRFDLILGTPFCVDHQPRPDWRAMTIQLRDPTCGEWKGVNTARADSVKASDSGNFAIGVVTAPRAAVNEGAAAKSQPAPSVASQSQHSPRLGDEGCQNAERAMESALVRCCAVSLIQEREAEDHAVERRSAARRSNDSSLPPSHSRSANNPPTCVQASSNTPSATTRRVSATAATSGVVEVCVRDIAAESVGRRSHPSSHRRQQ